FRLVPPRRRKGVFLGIPFRMIVVPVSHDLIHLATVDAARLPPSFLDEVAEECGTWPKRHVVGVAVQGLGIPNPSLAICHFPSLAGSTARPRVVIGQVAPSGVSRARPFGSSSRASRCWLPQTSAECRVPAVRRPAPERRVVQPALWPRTSATQMTGG